MEEQVEEKHEAGTEPKTRSTAEPDKRISILSLLNQETTVPGGAPTTTSSPSVAPPFSVQEPAGSTFVPTKPATIKHRPSSSESTTGRMRVDGDVSGQDNCPPKPATTVSAAASAVSTASPFASSPSVPAHSDSQSSDTFAPHRPEQGLASSTAVSTNSSAYPSLPNIDARNTGATGSSSAPLGGTQRTNDVTRFRGIASSTSTRLPGSSSSSPAPPADFFGYQTLAPFDPRGDDHPPPVLSSLSHVSPTVTPRSSSSSSSSASTAEKHGKQAPGDRRRLQARNRVSPTVTPRSSSSSSSSASTLVVRRQEKYRIIAPAPAPYQVSSSAPPSSSSGQLSLPKIDVEPRGVSRSLSLAPSPLLTISGGSGASSFHFRPPAQGIQAPDLPNHFYGLRPITDEEKVSVSTMSIEERQMIARQSASDLLNMLGDRRNRNAEGRTRICLAADEMVSHIYHILGSPDK